MRTSITDFLKQLKTLKIVDRDDLSSFLRSWPDQRPEQDAGCFARALIDRQLLTEYQAKVILRGKGHLLCMKNYLIKKKIEKGGMGTVFLATHRTMQRDVALKVLSNKKLQDSTAIQRFLQEARTAAKLCHPHITVAFDADQDHGHWYLVSEFVDGDDFQQLVESNGSLFPSVAIDLILQAAKALEFAHESGVTHRDIKPSNLMLNREGKVKLLDLGLARLEDGKANTRITCSEVMMGTPHYMSPEQAEQIEEADARSDIYSLGCTLFFLLTGEPPYNEQKIVRALMAHRTRPVPDLRDYRDGVSSELQLVFARMVAKDPLDRYQSMSEVIEDFELMKAGEPPRRAVSANHASADPGIPPIPTPLNHLAANQSAEYYLDECESHANVPTWQIVSEQVTTSIGRAPAEPQTAVTESADVERSRGLSGMIASGLTSMLSFLKLSG